MNPVTMALIRQILTIAGALAVAVGLLSADQVSALTNDIIAAIGAVTALVSVVWSIWHVIQAQRAAAVSAVVSAKTGTPVVVQVTGLKAPTVADHKVSPTTVADVAKVKGAA